MAVASAEGNVESIDGYRIVRPLGDDGATFLAHDRFLDRAVVLTLLPEAPGARRARLAVARAFARVSHPNLGRVHRVREEGARPYVVAAYARGQRLDTLTTPLQGAEVLELGRGLSGALAELHALGAAHGDVRAARVIFSDDGGARLVGHDRARADAGAAAQREDVHGLLATLSSVADRDLKERLARLDGAQTAEALRRALDALARAGLHDEPLSDNPYRGLRPFERENAAAFFGRHRELVDLVERLRSQPWLLVAGRSGTGKSSLVRAGVAPAIAAGALDGKKGWKVATMVPGARPLEALARAIAPLVGQGDAELSSAIRLDAGLAGRLARGSTDRGLLLVVDQLEEAMTLAGEDERRAFCAVLERFGALAPGVRVLFTLRSDFLARLVELGPFGADLLRATYVLPAMGREELRAAIALPARARGVEFESRAMVDALVDEVSAHGEALPLLSFALAELWNARDPSRNVIPEGALRRLGGAVAALARHGDLLLATLSGPERLQARRILLALVADESPSRTLPGGETRTRPTARDLVAGRGEAARSALEALVRGRLVVVGETCEIAHEALARAWPRLREWLDKASEARAAAERVRRAAAEWARIGRTEEALFGERQLAELDALPGLALSRESKESGAFVAASRAALRRARLRRRAPLLGLPLLLAVLGGATWMVSSARYRAAVARAVAGAMALDAKAGDLARATDVLRAEAIALFEKDDLRTAENLWSRVLALEEETEAQRHQVAAALDAALALDPRDPGARALYADLTFARLLAAERLHQNALQRELRARLAIYDDDSRAARLRAPARVRIDADPPGARLTLSRYRDDEAGRLVETDRAPLAASEPRELEPGSYLVLAEAPGRYPTRYPLLARRGEERVVRVVLPPAASVPAGMVYVPAGRVLYGSADDEATRRLFTHQPVHEVDVGAFLIARTEVTNGEYLAFLASLSPPERATRRTEGLTLLSDGRIALRLRTTALEPGVPYCSGASPSLCIDWSRLPVDGASREDGEGFAEWLARSGHLPRARLCTDREWERAARGADERRYPSGTGDLGPDDACTRSTYGGDESRAGPCLGGTHPATRSPFGVDDLAGNEWEWTAGPADRALPRQAVARGAGWFDEGTFLAISNRGVQGAGSRFRSSGLRVCADVDPEAKE